MTSDDYSYYVGVIVGAMGICASVILWGLTIILKK